MSGTQAAGSPSRGGRASQAARRGADNRGGVTVHGVPGRTQTPQDARKWVWRYRYPLRALNALTGLIAAHRVMQAADGLAELRVPERPQDAAGRAGLCGGIDTLSSRSHRSRATLAAHRHKKAPPAGRE